MPLTSVRNEIRLDDGGLTFVQGGSALQSPLIMPMLQLDRVPAQYAGAQITYLLTNSEFFFPPLNMLSTLSNLAATITCYLYKDSNRALSAKLPYVAVGFAMNVATTAYALTIMVPMNRQMVKHASSLEANSSDEKSEKELRRLQNKWKTLNYGECTQSDLLRLRGPACQLCPPRSRCAHDWRRYRRCHRLDRGRCGPSNLRWQPAKCLARVYHSIRCVFLFLSHVI